MSTPSNTNSNSSDEIDLGQVFRLVGRFFKKVFRLFFIALRFFKRKAILLIGVLLVGFLLGIVYDYFNEKKLYKQEIIIEPNLNSTTFLYNYIEKFNHDLSAIKKGESVLPEVTSEQLGKIRKIELLPIRNYNDILDYYNKYNGGNTSGGYAILSEIEDDFKKYRDQFRFHKLVITFKSDTKDHQLFVQNLLNGIRKNPYFISLEEIRKQELKDRIAENEKSVKFINSYIDKISSSDKIAGAIETVAVGNDIPTVTTLLKEKDRLLTRITEDKEELELRSELVKIVENNSLVRVSSLLYNKAISIPLILLGIVLSFYFISYLLKALNRFVEAD